MDDLQPTVLAALVPAVERLLRRVAEDEVMSRFNHLEHSDIHTKGTSSDLVTTADLEAEKRIREGLLEILPGSLVIGEESAYQTPEILHHLDTAKPVWIIDPLDGTHNFAHAQPCFAVICALVEKGETVLGWILDPVCAICMIVRKGHGVRQIHGDLHEGPKLTMRNVSAIEALRGSIAEGVRKRLETRPQEAKPPMHFVRYHCVGREYMDLISGKLNFALYGGNLWPWDHAAGTLMVAEAGGTARTLNAGLPYSPRSVRHGAGMRAKQLLIAPDAATFGALERLFSDSSDENGLEKRT